jgi:hypothetical protein
MRGQHRGDAGSAFQGRGGVGYIQDINGEEPKMNKIQNERMNPMKAYAIVEGLEEDGDESLFIEAMQYLVDSGLVWNAPGRIGRAAASMIEAGIIEVKS